MIYKRYTTYISDFTEIDLWFVLINIGHHVPQWKEYPTVWFRWFGNGSGWVIKSKEAPLMFSERYGHTKTWVIGGWRFKRLKKAR